jgi:hypothetical protein
MTVLARSSKKTQSKGIAAMLDSARRRYPRLKLDVDWFVESHGCSTLGRGLEISPRGATLPVTCRSPFSRDVTLYVALPDRAKMFKAKGNAVQRANGWAIVFRDVMPDDLNLLARTLIDEFGVEAVRGDDRNQSKSEGFSPRVPDSL